MLNKLLVSVIASVAVNSAVAATQTWDFSTANKLGSCGYNCWSSFQMTQGTNTLTITGWADTGGSSDHILEQGDLKLYQASSGGGLGMLNQDDPDNNPQHSVDNVSDSDMLLLSFTEAVSLEELSWTWQTSNDISVVGYTGGAGGPSLAGNTWGQVLGQGWSGYNHGDAALSGGWYQVLEPSASLTSKYWLVGAYNANFSSLTNIGNLYGGNDGFKFSDATTTTSNPVNEVPEPGSMALFALGILGLARMRGRTS